MCVTPRADSTVTEAIPVNSEGYQHNDHATQTGCDFGYSSHWRVCAAEVIDLGRSWESAHGRAINERIKKARAKDRQYAGALGVFIAHRRAGARA